MKIDKLTKAKYFCNSGILDKIEPIRAILIFPIGKKIRMSIFQRLVKE